ncbi:hypothetical protein N0V82_002396 [Gnomoniopsis sp. IMI 355080]|nr:hypothetical protein N0V82_002396 [Gnomoniopsis sp. IMI 355080]
MGRAKRWWRRYILHHDGNDSAGNDTDGTATPVPSTDTGESTRRFTNAAPYHPVTSDSEQEAELQLQASRRICCIWDDAYKELSELNPGLVADYEVALKQAITESTDLAQNIPQSRKMTSIINTKLKTLEEKEWKLKYKGHELKMKDLIEPVVSIVAWAKSYIGNSVGSSAPASLAWAGVCLLLPLLLNPSLQSKGRIKALGALAETINRCHFREALYQRRYENKQEVDSTASGTYYYESFKSLCIKILTFQTTCVGALSRNLLIRDMFKWEDWDTLMAAVNTQERDLQQTEDLLKDLENENQLNNSEKRHAAIVEMTSTIQRELEHIRNMIEETKGSATLSWLATSVDPSSNYNAARKKHGQICRSGVWLVESVEFKMWTQEPKSLLWLHGKAGVIHYLETQFGMDLNTAIAYYYFDFQKIDTQTTEALLRSVVANLCRQRPSLPGDIVQWHKVNKSPSMEDLERVLKTAMEDFSNVFIIVDALDECPISERGEVLGVIQRLKDSGPANLHLLLTSRPETDIRFSMEPLCKESERNAWTVDLQLHRHEVDADIATIIDEAFERHPFAVWSDGNRRKCRELLIQKAHGMFQYVTLQIEGLRNQGSNEISRQNILKNFPDGLKEIYDRILLQIPKADRKTAHRALQWLAFCDDELSVGELAEVAIIDSDIPHARTNTDLLAFRRLDPPERILSMLQGPVVVSEDLRSDNDIYNSSDDDSDIGIDAEPNTHAHRGFKNDFRTVLLSHFTVKEYLAEEKDTLSTTIWMEFSMDDVSAKTLIAESYLWHGGVPVMKDFVKPTHCPYIIGLHAWQLW